MTGTLVAHTQESNFDIEMLADEEQEVDTNRLEALVVAKTNQTIRDLSIVIRDGCVVLTGRTSRYYNKQLASQAILEQEMLVDNAIEVL